MWRRAQSASAQMSAVGSYLTLVGGYAYAGGKLSITIQIVANWVHKGIFNISCCDSRALYWLCALLFS